VAAMRITPPMGARLLNSCTPTQAEVCFNAIDDNCNGVIDEGCGVHTGTVQFELAWNGSKSKVAFYLLLPPDNHRMPDSGEAPDSPGFHHDRNCSATDDCGGQNVENIYFDGVMPPKGHYEVHVTLDELGSEEPPIRAHFGVRIEERSVAYELELTPGTEGHRSFGFDIR